MPRCIAGGVCGLRCNEFLPMKMSINHSFCQIPVSIDAAITEEGSMAADVFLLFHITFHDHDFLLIMAGSFHDRPERIADKRSSPEIEAGVGRAFMADAIDCRHVDAVGQRMRALGQLPGLMLARA